MTINIHWLPYWEPIYKYASSRLRCLFHHENINAFHGEKYRSLIGIDPDLAAINTNILIITQKLKEENLQKVLQFKENRNNIIIYDIVDNYYTDEKVKRLFNLSDYIIVANSIQKGLISKHVDKTIYVIPDAIDYPEQLSTNIVNFNNKICWFGNNNGLNDIKTFLVYLDSLKYNINIIGQTNYYKRILNIGTCKEWNYETFVSDLRQSSICLLTHDLNQQQKSNNKLLVSIANGVPVLSYQSKSYEEILRKFNLNYAVINSRQDLLNAILILSKKDQRKKYMSRIQPYILENFDSKIITNKLIETIEEIQIEKEKIVPKVEIINYIKPKNNLIPEFVKKDPFRKRIVLYTANIDGYDNFTEIAHRYPDHIDYVYFTDKEWESRTWNVKVVDKTDDPYLCAKYYKIMPHVFFPNYDISIWIDASAVNIRTNFQSILEHLRTHNFVTIKHPSRRCIYEEAKACIRLKKDNKETIQCQIEKYQSDNYPKENGLYSCGFLVRRHNILKEFSEAWWEEIVNNSKRDQLSCPYVLSKFEYLIKMKTLEFKEHEMHFNWKRHKSTQLNKHKSFKKMVDNIEND